MRSLAPLLHASYVMSFGSQEFGPLNEAEPEACALHNQLGTRRIYPRLRTAINFIPKEDNHNTVGTAVLPVLPTWTVNFWAT
jgi:hypothetical protein